MAEFDRIQKDILKAVEARKVRVKSPEELKKQEEEAQDLFKFLYDQELLKGVVTSTDALTPTILLFTAKCEDQGELFPTESVLLKIASRRSKYEPIVKGTISLEASVADVTRVRGSSEDSEVEHYFQDRYCSNSGSGYEYCISGIGKNGVLKYTARGSRILTPDSFALSHGGRIGRVYKKLYSLVSLE